MSENNTEENAIEALQSTDSDESTVRIQIDPKRIAKLIARILITALLLTWVFLKIDVQQFTRTAGDAKWELLVAAWIITLFTFLVNAARMKLILRKQQANARFATIFGASAVTFLYGLLLPGILSTSIKWYLLKKETGKGANVLSSMVYNQLTIIFTATAVGLVALALSNPTSVIMPDIDSAWLLPTLCTTALAAVITVALLLLSPNTGGKIITLLKLMLAPLPRRLRDRVRHTFDRIATFSSAGARFHLTMFLLTLAGPIACSIAVFIAAAKAANINVPFTVFLWLWPTIFLLGRLPISIANLGVREVTLVSILALYAVEASAALLMSMIMFSCIILMAAVGAVFQIYWSLTASGDSARKD